MKSTFLILGNQLFPLKHLSEYSDSTFVMIEHAELASHFKYHKHKIILFFSAMRTYAEELKAEDFKLIYQKFESKKASSKFTKDLHRMMGTSSKLVCFEIEDKFFESEIVEFCRDNNIDLEFVSSPMFLCSRDDFKKYNDRVKKPFMKNFYESQRKNMKVLVDKDLKPVRGKWSYDAENRKKIPKDLKIPKSSVEKFNYHTKITEKVKETIDKYFGNHPGESADFCFPVSRKDYEKNFKYFLKNMMNDFGSYQDSITNKSPFLFHSLISPGMNLGLITPEEVTRWTLQWYSKNPDAPLNSVEGFLRQVIGWREFIRGIYQEYSEVQDKKNFFSHKNKMSAHWYRGDTGIPPLDDAIKRALKYSYSHHIDRLMVLSNIMLLCELDPKEVHKWFMELYMDSSDWVMGPNVYGMGQFSDGGIFATKPYISGSNYILKMSDYKKGDWCEVMDGLYWRFVDKNSEFFASNPRMKMMMSALDRMNEEKKKRIFLKAEEFIKKVTK